MSRSLTAGMQSAIQADNVKPVLFLEIEFVGSTLRLTSHSDDISFNSQTWLGNGWMNPFSSINETTDIRAENCQLKITGADAAALALAFNSTNQSKKCRIYLGCLDSSNALIADPAEIFNGNFDTAEITDDGQNADIILDYESDLIRLQKSDEFRYTDQSQQVLFPGDTGFRYVPSVSDWTGFWGTAPSIKWVKRINKNKNKH